MVGGAARLQELFLATVYATFLTCFSAPGAYRLVTLANLLVLLRVLASGIRLETRVDGHVGTVLKHARFDLVDKVPLLHLGYDFDNSPMTQQ